MNGLTDERIRKKNRSPSYPAIGLADAIEKTSAIYRTERRNWAPVDAVMESLGYTVSSGQGRVVIAALKKYGLIDDEGVGPDRKVRLSDAGLRIVLLEGDDSGERDELIREAALTPTINRELWQEYQGDFPSDGTLRRKLLIERGFTERAVTEFIPQFRKTVEFANLTGNRADGSRGVGSATPQDERGPVMNQAASYQAPSPTPLAGGGVPMMIPIAPNEYVTLQGAFPLTEDKWSRMVQVLRAMKPALVAPSDSAEDTSVVEGLDEAEFSD